MSRYLPQIREFLGTQTTVSSEEQEVFTTLIDKIQKLKIRKFKIRHAIQAEKKRHIQETQTIDAQLRQVAFENLFKEREEIQNAHLENMSNLEKEDMKLRLGVIPRVRAALERYTKNGKSTELIEHYETRLSQVEARREAIKKLQETAEAADKHDEGDFQNILGLWVGDSEREEAKFRAGILRLKKKYEMLESQITLLEVRIEMKMSCRTRRLSV